MKVVMVQRGASCATGIVHGDSVRLTTPWHKSPARESPFVLPRGPAEGAEIVRLDDVQLLPPLRPGSTIFCVGLNYRAHTAEADRPPPAQPSIFIRMLASVVGDGQPIVRPRVSEQFDFEGEIAIVIGAPGRHIPRYSALDHVYGYTCFMDGSVRDFQTHAVTAGKNFQRSGAIGPWIVTADEIGDPGSLELSTWLNGTRVQHARASEMIFDIPTIVSYVSSWSLLQPGDVIATGTPSGVGLFREPRLWLRQGDTLEVRIDAVGTLVNHVVEEDADA